MNYKKNISFNIKLSNIKKNKIHFHIFDTCTSSTTYERINDYSCFFIEN